MPVVNCPGFAVGVGGRCRSCAGLANARAPGGEPSARHAYSGRRPGGRHPKRWDPPAISFVLLERYAGRPTASRAEKLSDVGDHRARLRTEEDTNQQPGVESRPGDLDISIQAAQQIVVVEREVGSASERSVPGHPRLRRQERNAGSNDVSNEGLRVAVGDRVPKRLDSRHSQFPQCNQALGRVCLQSG